MDSLTRAACLQSRFDPTSRNGFYESYFQRANHPTRPLAFWIRYTVFVPSGRPEAACGELWAIYFDGERARTCAVQSELPIAGCSLSRTAFEVRIGQATLQPGRLLGQVVTALHEYAWSLEYSGDAEPLLLLPAALYAGGFPRAKSLVATPHARYSGSLTVDGERIAVDGWPGSQNHNWGTRHTDRYLWGQVSGFDQDETAFLECASARVRLGPWLSPTLTMLVLRLDGEELRANSLLTGLRASASRRNFDWQLSTRVGTVQIGARLHAPAEAFVALQYRNPPGAEKRCLNTKLAAAELTVSRPGRPVLRLSSAHRAAFEILE